MAETNNIIHFLNYPSSINTCTTHHPTPQNDKPPSKTKKQKTTLENKDTTPKSFLCQFCPRSFTSTKALGGHQNAHRRERAALRATGALLPPLSRPPILPSPALSLSSASSSSSVQFGSYYDDGTLQLYDPSPFTGFSDGGGFMMGFGQEMMNDNTNEDGLNLELTLAIV